MAQTRGDRPARAKKEDPLQPALEQLARSLTGEIPGREGGWAADVGNALGDLESALQQHIANAEAPDGLLAEVDLTRPTLVRRVGVLRKEHADFLDQASAFRGQVQKAAQAFQTPAQPPASDVLPEPAGVGSVADFSALRQEGERLAGALKQHLDEEASLALESVTTDIGVGD
jgi:hypothetical protein